MQSLCAWSESSQILQAAWLTNISREWKSTGVAFDHQAGNVELRLKKKNAKEMKLSKLEMFKETKTSNSICIQILVF